jgi:mono/diheme cytochrome c family protein
MVVRRGFSQPPSFHIERLQKSPAGYFFGVITNGYNRMPAYAAQIPVKDRWAIVAYLRALQLSQDAKISDVPQDERKDLEENP